MDAIPEKVDSLLAEMTLEEKVGQMAQLTIQAVSRTRSDANTHHELDPEKLRAAIVDHHVGSLLNVWDAAFTPEYWHEVIRSVQDLATRETRLGIPVIYGIDAVHGHHYMQGATIFPQNLALAATWDLNHIRRANEITAVETRASGIPWNFAPVLDVARMPLWSRVFETFGEDVFLSTEMGRVAIEAMQGDDVSAGNRVAATAKHFLGYSLPMSGKDRTQAWIPERFLREYFLPPFEAAFDAGVKTLMINSGEINGIPVHASRWLLTDLLRGELGFEGVAVTDWEDIRKLHNMHFVAPTEKEATRMAVMAGVDMSMVPYSAAIEQGDPSVPFGVSFIEHLLELVHEGSVPETRIDESVRRILALKYELGLFDNPYPDAARLSEVGTAAHNATSREMAAEAITLLKNDASALPLARDAKVLLTGPGATSLPALHGSWTYTWQGTEEGMYPEETRTIVEALEAEVGAEHVVHVPGASFDEVIDIAAAVDAARATDVAVVVLAEFPSVEKPGDINSLELPEAQARLVTAVAETGTPVVLVLVQNRPVIIRDVEPLADAVLLIYQPGPHGGAALADVLYGDINPSGKLPVTYPRHEADLAPYDHKPADAMHADGDSPTHAPQYEFGHGLSYTTFAYRDLALSPSEIDVDGEVTVTVTVENVGDRAGKEVVQLYVRDDFASITPSVKRLRGFQKIDLAPGEAHTVTLALPAASLAFIGSDNQPVVEAGTFTVMVGDLSGSFSVR